eukprot:NODE_22913_length_689_cov_0.973310.p1 GENE.NODE_22913_length_689_cov_0.973310~~NODE_22913_length_689_cov_0.973310.p1  ORF type:complete len:152 (-),score=46.79 NODE_22913_length_689_cov_0.973310:91-546(-)
MHVDEDKIMRQYDIPTIHIVGMEGMFGLLFGLPFLVIMDFTNQDSSLDAIYQLSHSPILLAAIIASVFSVAFFNFSGVTVTQRASAVARSTIDVSRTVSVWAVELVLGWNSFSTVQFVGFIVLTFGTLLYNRIIVIKQLEPLSEEEPIVSP